MIRCLCLCALVVLGNAAWYNPIKDVGRVQSVKAKQHVCDEPAYVFTRYLPSSWEDEWLMNAKSYALDICGKQREKPALSAVWADTSLQYEKGNIPDIQAATSRADVWSKFHFRRGCSHKRGASTLTIPIEPAVGHLRHPYWHNCVPPGVTPVDIEDRSYMLVNALPQSAFFSLYPGRHFLFDMGMGPGYNSSLKWFVDHYSKHGVSFNDIWTWEVSPLPDHTAFWEDVPIHIRSKLHLHNTAITAKNNDAFSPIQLIKSVYEPGDFIVIKLDIEGNTEVEGAIISALMHDDEFRDMIGEIYYELHFENEIFGLQDISLEDALISVRKLRERGVRLHYWP